MCEEMETETGAVMGENMWEGKICVQSLIQGFLAEFAGKSFCVGLVRDIIPPLLLFTDHTDIT